ncbi:MAG: hypothetical protein KUL82_02735, partial [Bdellovibrio sp.]|nr:hypothetical protein [Bdellovibrio sp.]
GISIPFLNKFGCQIPKAYLEKAYASLIYDSSFPTVNREEPFILFISELLPDHLMLTFPFFDGVQIRILP